MKEYGFFFFFVFFVLFMTSFSCKKLENPDLTASQSWENGEFTFILYDGLTQEAAQPILRSLNENTARIQADLKVQGVTHYTVHLWARAESFLTAQEQYIGTRYPGSSGYVIDANAMGLLNSATADDHAVHEYAHSMSLWVQPHFANNPRWLWEAVALYESGDFVHPNQISYLVSGNYPHLSELNADYNNGSRKIYDVGYLLLEFILQRWGQNTMIDLIKQNGNIEGVLQITTAQFEVQWKEFVQKKYFGR